MKVTYVLLFYACFACIGKKENPLPPEKCPVEIDLSEPNFIDETLQLSEIADKIEYIPLQNDSKSLLANINEFKVTDSLILIRSYGEILTFNLNGKFLGRFPPQGRGPGEDFVIAFTIDEQSNTVYTFGNYREKIMRFSYEGKFLGEDNPPSFEPRVQDLFYWKEQLFYVPDRNAELLAFSYNPVSGELFHKYRNSYQTPERFHGRDISGITSFHIITYQKYKDSFILFRDQFCDTLYQTTDFKKISPRYLFKRNDDDQATYMDYMSIFYVDPRASHMKKKFFIYGVLETSAFLFWEANGFEKNGLGLFNKRTKQCRIFKNEQCPYPIINDLDGGPDITAYDNGTSQWLRGNRIYNLIWPLDLLGHQGTSNRSETVTKLYQNLQEDSNPILMIVTLKK